jgi:hypothetical protein
VTALDCVPGDTCDAFDGGAACIAPEDAGATAVIDATEEGSDMVTRPDSGPAPSFVVEVPDGAVLNGTCCVGDSGPAIACDLRNLQPEWFCSSELTSCGICMMGQSCMLLFPLEGKVVLTGTVELCP